MADNPQAFPSPHYSDRHGMTLRDYFAAQALAGMHARDMFDPGQAEPKQRAIQCYIDADAMLAAREAKP